MIVDARHLKLSVSQALLATTTSLTCNQQTPENIARASRDATASGARLPNVSAPHPHVPPTVFAPPANQSRAPPGRAPTFTSTTTTTSRPTPVITPPQARVPVPSSPPAPLVELNQLSLSRSHVGEHSAAPGQSGLSRGHTGQAVAVAQQRSGKGSGPSRSAAAAVPTAAGVRPTVQSAIGHSPPQPSPVQWSAPAAAALRSQPPPSLHPLQTAPAALVTTRNSPPHLQSVSAAPTNQAQSQGNRAISTPNNPANVNPAGAANRARGNSQVHAQPPTTSPPIPEHAPAEFSSPTGSQMLQGSTSPLSTTGRRGRYVSARLRSDAH